MANRHGQLMVEPATHGPNRFILQLKVLQQDPESMAFREAYFASVPLTEVDATMVTDVTYQLVKRFIMNGGIDDVG
jgi:hypothetical protein